MTEPTTCPICDGPMFGLHCKLLCKNCGYREDCSDLFPHRPPEPAGANVKSPLRYPPTLN